MAEEPQKITSDRGWTALMHALGVVTPFYLRHTHRASLAIRSLRRR